MRPFQVPGRKVERLVGERGIGPHLSQRERGLDGQHGRERPPGPVEDGREPRGMDPQRAGSVMYQQGYYKGLSGE